MAFTYSGDPSSSSSDFVRFLIGDTDSTDALLQDEEIAHLLAETPDVRMAASKAALGAAAKLARRVNGATGRVRKDLAAQYEHYADLAKRLQREATMRGAEVEAGGVFKDDVRNDQLDESLVQPEFEVGVHDDPRSATAFDPKRDCH